jgi:tripartite ATP-independent transporter DctM subunit
MTLQAESAPTLTGTVPPPDRHRKTARRFQIALVVVAVVAAALVVYLLTVPTDPVLVGILVIFVMMGLMLLKVPVGIAMSVTSFVGLLVLGGEKPLAATLQESVYGAFASWSLSVIPMFVLMGIALGKSGLMDKAYDSALKWLGRLPGGLAIATNFAAAGIHAAGGSTIGITYAIGRVSIPKMIRSGYKPSLAMASTGMAGTLGQVLPPSVLMVIYAGVAETPVGPQLIAGIVPGIMIGLLFVGVILIWATVSPKSAPRGPKYSWRERFASLTTLIPVVLIIVVVIGGIFFGVFTATEAGAYGAAITIIVGLFAILHRRRVEKKTHATATASTGRLLGDYFSSMMLETVSVVSGIFVLLIGVNLLTRVMALSGLANVVADWVVGLHLSQIEFLLLLIPIYLILGIFLETLPLILLTVPIFLAPLEALHVNLIWFGVFLIVQAEINLVIPPFGVLNFIVLNLTRRAMKGTGVRVSLTDVFKGVSPFIAAAIVALVILIAWPELALWLPGQAVQK